MGDENKSDFEKGFDRVKKAANDALTTKTGRACMAAGRAGLIAGCFLGTAIMVTGAARCLVDNVFGRSDKD